MLPKLEGYASALMEPLDITALAAIAEELRTVEQTILSRYDLRAVLTDTSIPGNARGQILRDLLLDKVDTLTLRLCVYAATSAPAQEVPKAIDELATVVRHLSHSGHFHPENLGHIEARRRVGGFADALLDDIDTSNFARVEEELFRWARTIESSLELRRLLLDRDAALESREGAVQELLGSKVNDVTLRLAKYVIAGGRPRDVVGTLDFLVDYVARARDWRVARVFSARELTQENQSQLVSSLATLTGKSVELQIAQQPDLLGGVLVEVGDLRLDATTKGRLGALHDAVTYKRLYESTMNRND
ncbi:MAG: F0F1 ATP synthase subunit delta [Acidimicrobiales bacterium]